MSKRIYVVRAKHGAVTKVHLIRAHSHEHAIRKASEGAYTSELASQDMLVQMLSDGHKVVDAGVSQEKLPLEGNEAT